MAVGCWSGVCCSARERWADIKAQSGRGRGRIVVVVVVSEVVCDLGRERCCELN